MQYMISWTLPSSTYEACVKAYLETGAPVGEGMKSLGRWHAPGSVIGWHLVEGDETAVAAHVAQWSSVAQLTVTPVIGDEAATAALSKAFGE